MHCISCELILEKALKDIEDIQLLMVNHKKGIMEIEYMQEKAYKQVIRAIEKNGFSVLEENKKSKITLNQVLNNIAIYLGLAIMIYLVSMIDIYKYIPDTSTLSYS